jgi:hypothetical protein
LPDLEALIRDGTLAASRRLSAIEAYEAMADRTPESRPSLVALLTEILADFTERAGSLTDDERELASAIVYSLADLAGVEARPVIDAAFAADVTEEHIVTPEDVDEWYRRPHEPQPEPAESFLADYRERYEDDSGDDDDGEDDGWYLDDESHEREWDEGDTDGATAPIVRPKIGRNEPCPCGSGKKYKKCCLGKAETTEATPGPHAGD